ncbi:sugar ABC transporter permease [Sulfolobales archaeon HS-7]|nr:sugar ABC transporter permease [Sulfolobales archaeon HS-7]
MRWGYIAIIILVMFFLYPIYVLFLVSFVPPQYTVDRLYPDQIPVALTLHNIIHAIENAELTGALDKSLIVATIVGILALVLGIPAAYGLSKLEEKVATLITTLLFVVNMMPAIVIAIPIAADFIKIGLFDSALGLALAQELVVLPISTFILLGSFQSIPRDLENQARVDGAGIFRALFDTILPVAREGIIATFLLAWMTSWDEFTYAILISPIKPTLPVHIYLYTTRGSIIDASAFSLLLTLPVLALTLGLQKYLRGEYLGGGIKA